MTSTTLKLSFDRFHLDEADARLMLGGKPVPLPPKPFAVLCALARRAGTLVTKNALLDSVWGHRFVTESALKTTISALRSALGDDSEKPCYIETVPRRGYRFIAGTGPSMQAAVSVPAQQASLFADRAEPLARLRNAWDRACAGTRQLVWVAGEAGVGKTALHQALALLTDTSFNLG